MDFQILLYLLRREGIGSWVIFISSQVLAIGAVPVVCHLIIVLGAGGISLLENDRLNLNMCAERRLQWGRDGPGESKRWV